MFYHFMRTTCLAVLLSFVVAVSAAEALPRNRNFSQALGLGC